MAPTRINATMNGTPCTLTKVGEKAGGLSKGGIYAKTNGQHLTNELFFLKLPKNRTLLDLFRHNFPGIALWQKGLEQAIQDKNEAAELKYSALLAPFVKHKQDLLLLHAFNAVFASKLFPILFKVVLPEVFLHIEADGTPVLFSRVLPDFTEFLSKAKAFRDEKKQKSDLKPVPYSRRDLVSELGLLDSEEGREQLVLIGRLYFAGLFTGHMDIFSNTCLANSGNVREQGSRALSPAIVDLEPLLGGGFSSLSADDNAFNNPQFKRGVEAGDEYDYLGFNFCVPFDERVLPMLPRQLCHDLFTIPAAGSRTEIDKLILKGFEQAYHEALQVEKNIASLVENALTQTFASMPSEYATRIKQPGVLPQSFYFPTAKALADPSTYNLANILRGRLGSIGRILQQLHKGRATSDISKEEFTKMATAQARFFHQPPQLSSMPDRNAKRSFLQSKL